MNKIITSLIFTLAILFNINSFANDPKSKGLLDKVTAQIKSNSTFKTTFTYNALDKKGRIMGKGNGTLMVSGNKYNISTNDQKIVSDGKTVWTYLVANNEVHISDYSSNENALNPANFFATNFENEYNYSYKGTQKVAGKTLNSIYLDPKGAKPFNNLTIYVDNNGIIYGGLIVDKNGNKFNYTLSKLSKSDIRPEHFTFNARAYKGIDVIDLR